MSAGRAILSFIFSRTMLGLIGITLFGLALWFGGPYLAFGDARPLQSTGSRVLVLLLMLSFLLFWLLHWPVSIVGVTALSLLLWHGGPLLRIGDTAPLFSETARTVTISVLVFFFVVYLLYRLWLALRANEALLQKILHPGKKSGEASPAEEQLVEVRDVMRRALTQLRGLVGHVGQAGAWKGLFLHSRFIYELPWYMVFGAPGTGKTTAILNSGLKFPLGEQSGNISLAGISGTRNCLWWFTSEAVLIDTAGRYATHESNADIDSAEWKGFLGLLRKHRPRAPINGAILAINVEDLVGRGSDERRQLAAQLRQRLAELQGELRVVFPVYVLVTKMDLLKGFQPYFHNLNTEGRQQVLGFTLPNLKDGRAASGQGQQGGEHALRTLCEGEMRLLRERLEQGLDLRLREEYDTTKRRQLYCLPGEFEGLCQPLLHLLDDIFMDDLAARQGNNAGQTPLLRGVYFTSAVQQESNLQAEPNTFLQRVGHLARLGTHWGQGLWGRDAGNMPAASRPLIDSRSYFLQHVLRKVIFPESFLVRRNRRWEARFMLARTLCHVLLVLGALGLAATLITSERNNAALLTDMNQRTATLDESMRRLRTGEVGTAGGASLAQNLVPRILHEACALTEYSDLDLTSPPLAYGAGLFAAGPAHAEASKLCLSLRRQLLLPPLTKQLEDHVRQSVDALRATARAESQGTAQEEYSRQLFEALHLYAALHERARFDPVFILRAVHADMAVNGNNFFNHDSSLQDHLWTLLNDPQFRHGGKGDAELVAEARAALQGMSKPQRLYILARHQMMENTAELPSGVQDFLPAQATGDLSTLYRADNVSLATPIPALFTYAGYHQLFDPELPRFLAKATALDAWLMGEGGGTPTDRSHRPDRPDSAEQAEKPSRTTDAEQKRLLRAVRKLYFEEYHQQWYALVSNVRLNLGSTPDRALQLLGELSSPASVLDKLARAVVLETSLSARDPLPSGKDLAGVPGMSGLASQADKAGKALKAASAFNPADLDLITQVDKPFESLRAVVTGSPRTENTRAMPPSPVLKDIHALLTEYTLHMQQAFDSEQSRTLPKSSDIAERLRAKARQLPAFYSTALEGLAEQGSKQAGEARGRAMNKIMDAEVSEPCRKLLRGYPFVKQARDADPAEFARVFGPGGVLDKYFTEHLADMVDTSVSPWQYTKPAAGAPSLLPFEQAARLREALFGAGSGGDSGGAGAPKAGAFALEYHVQITELDPRIERFTLTVNDKQWQYSHGPSEVIPLIWSGASPKAAVEFSFRPRLGIRPVRISGPWALLRLMEMGVITQSDTPGQQWVEFDLDGYRLAMEVQTTEFMPLNSSIFESFQCPQAMP